MPLMLLLLLFLTGMVIWAFFHFMPHGVTGNAPLIYSVTALVVAVVASVLVSQWILSGVALDPKRLEKFGWYLAIVAGGLTFNIVVASAGLMRNFLLFPSRHGSPDRST